MQNKKQAASAACFLIVFWLYGCFQLCVVPFLHLVSNEDVAQRMGTPCNHPGNGVGEIQCAQLGFCGKDGKYPQNAEGASAQQAHCHGYHALAQTAQGTATDIHHAADQVGDTDVTQTQHAVVDDGGYQVAYYVVYMFDASLGEINIDEPSNILMKTANTEVDLLQINNKGLKQVIFVVTTVNRFRQESAVVDKVMYMY